MQTSRLKTEFFCQTECQKYFLTYLRDNMNGNYTIKCPNPSCGHEHYRVIENGVVTSDRCNEKKGQLDIIMGLKSTLRDTPYHNSPESRRSEMEIVN